LLHYFFSLVLILVSCCGSAYGQAIDSLEYDHDHLTDSEFFSRYSLTATPLSLFDIKVTRQVWSLKQIRTIAKELKLGIGGLKTMIEGRPLETNPYFIVGLYRVAAPDHYVRLGNYKIDVNLNVIQFKTIAEDKWMNVD
jgi:hypothetical protein